MNKIIMENGFTWNLCVGCGMMATKRIYEEGFFVSHRHNMKYSVPSLQRKWDKVQKLGV